MDASLVELRGVSKRASGPTHDAVFRAGEIVGLVEPESVQPTTLDLLRGSSPCRRGEIARHGKVVPLPPPVPRRRATLQAYCRSLLGNGDPARLAAALTELGLWEHRSSRAADHEPLNPVLANLLAQEEILSLPLSLDRFDPWTTRRVWRALVREAGRGRLVLLHTHRLELAALCDRLVVSDGDDFRFVGRPADLPERAPATIRVRTEHAPEVRALVQPFAIEIRDFDHGLEFLATEGQERAARLLVQGYGDVEYVLVRQPRFEDLVLGLLGQ